MFLSTINLQNLLSDKPLSFKGIKCNQTANDYGLVLILLLNTLFNIENGDQYQLLIF